MPTYRNGLLNKAKSYSSKTQKVDAMIYGSFAIHRSNSLSKWDVSHRRTGWRIVRGVTASNARKMVEHLHQHYHDIFLRLKVNAKHEAKNYDALKLKITKDDVMLKLLPNAKYRKVFRAAKGNGAIDRVIS